MLVGEFSRVLIHSVSMNLVWFFMGTKICHGKTPSWGGVSIVLRIVKQGCDQLRGLVCSPDVGPIVGQKCGVCHTFFDCPVARGGVLVIAY